MFKKMEQIIFLLLKEIKLLVVSNIAPKSFQLLHNLRRIY
jgi:hypothetical protein